MFHAQLRNKLSSEQENMEDILTSNVFGAFKYLPPEEALCPFLRLASRGKSQTLDLPPVKQAEYEFWPWWEEKDCFGCEPDVVLYLKHEDGTQSIVLIEAKYLSGKSSEAGEDERPYDQLAREWDNLQHVAGEKNARPYLVYLTNGYILPKIDLEAAQQELEKKRMIRGEMFWLSWHHLREALTPKGEERTAHLLIRDLLDLIDKRYAFGFFRGFSAFETQTCDWQFEEMERAHSWEFRSEAIGWSFDAIPLSTFEWPDPRKLESKWRFET